MADPWTATLSFIERVGFPVVVAIMVLRMLRDELREIRGRLDDLIGLSGGTARKRTGPPSDG